MRKLRIHSRMDNTNCSLLASRQMAHVVAKGAIQPIVVFAFLLFAIGACWTAQCFQDTYDPNDVRLSYNSRVGKATYRFTISKKLCASLPEWSPDEGSHPPITPKTAINVASKYLERLPDDPSLGKWNLDKLELLRLDDKKWIYLVVFENPPKSLEPIRPSEIKIPVTLEGKLVEPVVTFK